jgi:hypothetical protein
MEGTVPNAGVKGLRSAMAVRFLSQFSLSFPIFAFFAVAGKAGWD